MRALFGPATANIMGSGKMEFEYTPGTVSVQTITLRIGANSGSVTMNCTSLWTHFGGRSGVQFVVEEIKA